MKLYFVLGNEMVAVEIRGKKIYFSNTTLGFRRFVPIEPFIEKTYGIDKLIEFKEFLKKNVSEEEMMDYVIREFSSQGFKLKRRVNGT